jgi:hypothetical protein
LESPGEERTSRHLKNHQDGLNRHHLKNHPEPRNQEQSRNPLHLGNLQGLKSQRPLKTHRQLRKLPGRRRLEATMCLWIRPLDGE